MHKRNARLSAGEVEGRLVFWNVEQLDAVEWLDGFHDETVDLLITDPAYESLEKHRKKGTTTRLKHSKSSSNDWFPIFPNARYEELLKEIYRVLKNNTHFYMCCDQETMFIVKPIAERVGFKFWKPIVWDKQRIGMGYHYRARYELVLFFEKGKRKLNDLSIPDILEFPRVHKGYPTEKPVGLFDVLIRQSSASGDWVFDPFLGSGASGVASVRAGRSFEGADICAEAVSLARERLSGCA